LRAKQALGWVCGLIYYQKRAGYYQKSNYIIKTTLLLSKIPIYYQNRFLAVMGATGSELD
jgi:hypothetical protein